MTFIEAAKTVLESNGNKPMSSREIWEQINLKNLVDTKGKTPHLSINSKLCGNSKNLEEIAPERKSRTKSEVRNSIFKIVSQNPYKFVIDDYMNPKVKEIMIKNGFLTIEKLIDILDKNGINIKIE
jgi:hypothetical protein